MTLKLLPLALIFGLLSCTPKNSTESQTAETNQDSSAKQPPVPSKEGVPEVAKVQELPLTVANLTAFSFSTPYGSELIFLDSGKLSLSSLSGGQQKKAGYVQEERTIKITMGVDTASLEVESFTEDGLQLATSDRIGAKFFGEVLREVDGKATINLYRLIFSAPYPEDVVSGGWSDTFGGTNFEADGTFMHTEPDCVASGTWKFDGQNLNMTVTDKKCDVPFASGSFKVVRLARRLALLQKEDGKFEIWTRPIN